MEKNKHGSKEQDASPSPRTKSLTIQAVWNVFAWFTSKASLLVQSQFFDQKIKDI